MIKISILTGSGFSMTAKIAGVKKLNTTFIEFTKTRNLEKDYEDFRPPYFYKEILIRKFIQFYISRLMEKEFNYEDLYDFALKLSVKDIFEMFIIFLSDDNLIKEARKRDKNNLSNDFILKINKMVQEKLEMKPNQIGIYPEFSNFFIFLEDCIAKGYNIYFHTLNHDKLLEFLINQQSKIIRDNFCDGFETKNIKFKGYNTENERLEGIKMYTGDYNKNIKYYKLHGGINLHYVYRLRENGEYNFNEGVLLEIDSSIDVSSLIFKETSSNFKFNSFPLFLTGRENKLNSYNNSHYKHIINEFKSNLNNSELLLVIGYGCKDEEVNKIIIDNYLKLGKKVILIAENIQLPIDFDEFKDLIDIEQVKFENYDFTKIKLK